MMVPSSGKKPEFAPVISAFLDPLIQMCERAAEAHKSKKAVSLRRRKSDATQVNRSSVDALLTNSSSGSSISQNNETPSKIFLINCLCAIQQPLLRHDAASDYVASLSSTINNHIRDLVQREVEAILERCGLLSKMSHFQNVLKSAQGVAPLAEMEDTSPASLSECLKLFFGLVLGTETSLPEFELLQVPQLRSEACMQVAKSLAESYELVYNAIMDPKNSYPDPKSLARHPPNQIRTILGI